MGLNILHLSDIHLCGDAAPSVGTLLLGKDFYRGAPDIILVTGDLFDHSAFSQEKTAQETQEKITRNIKQGVAFCEELIHEINVYYDANLDKNSILFVPGNHEMRRSATNLTEFLQVYRLFLESFYSGGIPDWYLEDLTFVKEFDEEKVIIVGFRSPHFNSNCVSEKPYDDYGLVSAEQLLEIRKRLHKIKNLSDYSVVAALHHQFILMEERDKSYVDRSYLRNSEQFIRFLSEENICAVLHGHKHVNSNRRLNIELDITKPEKVITVLGCGSLSETDNENWFNYITVFPHGYKYDIEYSSYRRTTAGYILDKEAIKIPILSKRIDTLALRNAINEDPDLKRAYDDLTSYDSITQVESVFRVLDSTLFSLSSVDEQIINQPDLLYFVLATAHYRFLINRNAPHSIIEKVDKFIEGKKSLYFPGNKIFDQISRIAEIKDLAGPYKKNIDSLSHIQKRIIVFSAMVTLVVDYFLIMKYRCEEFYNTVVSKKIDFSYSGNNLSSELRGNTVDFSVDDERRSLEISVTCDTAEAVKISSLIIKEFEIVLHDFERDFSDFGFRIYYILPKLKYNGRHTNEIESRQFTSYIPKLLPLLAGRNIYSKPEAFAREVIQNSIDAINVRKEHDPLFKEDGRISITLGNDKNSGLSFFDIEDNGSGMTKYILERYLTTLGLSYYAGADYQALNLQYNPISQFGIGFLSCFMLGKHIEVYTRHYTSHVGYYLDIPNYDGCFFIEEDKSIHEVGTRIRIWENPEQKGTEYAFDVKKIKEYINQYIRNTSINIYINNELELPKNLLCEEIKGLTNKYKIHHFVPIEKKPMTGKWVALPTTENTIDHRFGVHLYKPDEKLYSVSSNHILLNDGILIPGLSGNEDALIKIGDDYFSVAANFPPDTLNLDVSRDNLKNFIANIDWKSIETSFKEYRRSTNAVNAPYYLMQQIYSAHRFKDSNLVFIFDRQKETITITCVDKLNDKNNSQSIISFLNYLSDDSFNKIGCPFPLQSIDCKKQYGEFTTSIISELYEVINSITNANLKGHISVDAHKREYDSAILNVLITREKPFYVESMSLSNKILAIQAQYINTPDNLESKLKALANAEKGYFHDVRKGMKSDITNMFKDRRYTSTDSGKAQSAEAVKKILNNPGEINSQLYKFLKSYLKRVYTSLPSSKSVSLVDVAGITISAVYLLLDMASIVTSYKELKSGITIRLIRDELEPSRTWFKSLKAHP